MISKGELYAGIRPDNKEPLEVEQVRGVIATLVDNLEAMDPWDIRVHRLMAMAQTKFEEGCMCAVKAIYLQAELDNSKLTSKETSNDCKS
jgi:hypothetical protein